MNSRSAAVHCASCPATPAAGRAAIRSTSQLLSTTHTRIRSGERADAVANSWRKKKSGAGPKTRTPPASVAAISRVVGEKRRRAVLRASAAEMAAPSERAAVKALADQRAGLEAEMEAVLSRLNAPGMPGVSGRLVDAEVCERRCGGCTSAHESCQVCLTRVAGASIWRLQGFPRADIDLHAVRNDRHRLAGARCAPGCERLRARH